MINQATLLGNVGQDPEIRHLNNGDAVATFSLATSERWRDRESGEQRERTEWHRVVCYNPQLIELIERNVRKGTKLFLQGTIRTRKWQTTDGDDRMTTEIVLERVGATLRMLGDSQGRRDDREPPREPAGDRRPPATAAATGRVNGSRTPPRIPPRDLDDEIPF